MSDDRKLLILLDVDGVLNPDFSSKQRSRAVYHDGWMQKKAWVDGRQYRLCVNPAHGSQLLKLAEELDAELAWGTTWGEWANIHVAPMLHLPVLRVAPAPAGRKAAPVTAWTAGRPFTWLDDSSLTLITAYHLASERCQSFRPVHVNSRHGLQPAHCDQIRAWARTLA
jgi:hypothetical protein